MLNRFLSKSLVLMLSVCIVYTPLLKASQLALPSGDDIAPVVKHKKFSDYVVKGQDYTIEATVTDNVAIKSVSLFYRHTGSNKYKRVYMKQVKGTDIYVTTLSKKILTPPGIEYYIQAMDIAGNNLLHGYSFAPLTVDVSTQVKQIVNKPIEKLESEEESSSSKWLWIGLGIVAVAAAAAASSGGGDDEPAATGSSVVITAPLP